MKTWHEQHREGMSALERVEEAIAAFCGTRVFFLLHVAWFAFWIARPIEAFPYGFLTMVVSLEAILLSTVIMINQRRHDKLAAAQADHDRRVEQESLKAIKHGLACLLRAKKAEYHPADAEWRAMLKDALVKNRSSQKSGSGDAYWESVVETVEDFLQARQDASA